MDENLSHILDGKSCKELFDAHDWIEKIPLDLIQTTPQIEEIGKLLFETISKKGCERNHIELKPPTGISSWERKRGIEVEREHNPTIKRIKKHIDTYGEWPDEEKIYEWISWDHFVECKSYYKRLDKMEEQCEMEEND